MEKVCLSCGKTLGQGRPDRKFCDHQCRSIYNYEHTPDNDPIVRLITSILKKNRRIMLDLNPDGKIKVDRHQLTDKGFDFNYYTHIYETGKANRYFYCYEMGYLMISDRTVLLVKKDNYNKVSDSPYAEQQIAQRS